jgi:hypothetical protein
VTDLFTKLEEEKFFIKFVGDFFNDIPRELSSIFECTVVVEPKRLDFAYRAYKQNIEKIALQLFSENPDHYKRAGALLQALQASSIIDGVDFVAELDDIECGFSPIHMRQHDTVKEMPFARFFENYANEMNSFILAYRCCAAYEPQPRRYDNDYLHVICVFLKGDKNHSVETLFMIFKSLMA